MSFRTRLSVAVGLFAAAAAGKTVLASYVSNLRTRETATLDRSLAEFPRTLGDWVGVDVPANAKMVKDIKADDYLNRVYTHPSGERVRLWFNYSGRSLDQYHYPTVCMEGAGWQEDESRRMERPFADVAQLKTGAPPAASCHMSFTRNQEKSQIYYWYYLIGEDPIDEQMRVASRYARVFLRGRQNPSLTVEVFSESANPNGERMYDFSRQVANELQQWMPPQTETCCELGATY